MKAIKWGMIGAVMMLRAAQADEATEFQTKLDALATEAPTSAYYFDKLAFDGTTWIPTVLIYGYPNNGGACGTILRAAITENPRLRFRCRAVR